MENAAKPTESNEPYKNSLEMKFMDSPVLTESLESWKNVILMGGSKIRRIFS